MYYLGSCKWNRFNVKIHKITQGGYEVDLQNQNQRSSTGHLPHQKLKNPVAAAVRGGSPGCSLQRHHCEFLSESQRVCAGSLKNGRQTSKGNGED